MNAGPYHCQSATDQRGFPRVVCTRADIGAVEVQDCPTPRFVRLVIEAPGSLAIDACGATRLTYELESSPDLARWSLRTNYVAGPEGCFSGLHLMEPDFTRLFFRLVEPTTPGGR